MTTVVNTQADAVPSEPVEPSELVERKNWVSRVRAWPGARWRRPAIARARKAARAIRGNTAGAAQTWEKLGVARPVTVGVRESVRAFHRARWVPNPYQRAGALYGISLIFIFTANLARNLVLNRPKWADAGAQYTEQLLHTRQFLVPMKLLEPLFTLGLLWVILVACWGLVSDLVSFMFGGDVRRFRPVVAVLRAVNRCGGVHGTTGPKRTDALLSLATSMKAVRKELRRVHRVRGTLSFRSSRGKAARAHARSVVKCLEAAEARIDVEGDQALAPLSDLLGCVAERYADGRLRALLDAELLVDYPAGRDWEALRLAVLAVVIAAGAVGAGLLALSDPVTAVLIASVGVVGVTLLYRKDLGKGINFLGLLKP
ncbi:hypothetical protein [Streptomyces sp. NPDC085665]|uniref:hypothetical protein n=1 Tax=Streptomyces sp. NPDC085665 TaxID=3365735 RepID=UPI0037D183D8